MSYPINYPTPQGANVQIFGPNTNAAADKFSATWVKPQGASFVWFTLIGAGGGGGSADSDASAGLAAGGGGGSGAITNCMMPAFLIPDTLGIRVYSGVASPSDTAVFYQNKTGTAYLLLDASSGDAGSDAVSSAGTPVNGAGGLGGAASTSNEFSAAGFFQSVAGVGGTAGNTNQTTSTTTFLQGGVGGSANQAVSQYGYSISSLSASGQAGYGILSPILVSVGTTSSTNAVVSVKSGFGSGGGGASTTGVSVRDGTFGGDGLVVIVTW